MTFNISDFASVSPIIFLSILALLLLVIDGTFRRPAVSVYWTSLVGLIVCGFLTVNTYFASGTAFGGMVFTGRFPAFFEMVFLLSAALSVLLSRPYLEKENVHFGEYYTLIVLATVGMMLMASAT